MDGLDVLDLKCWFQKYICLGQICFFIIFYYKLTFPYSKLAFLTQNSLLLLKTHFSYSKLAFLTWNLLFLLETHFLYSKNSFLTQNSFLLLKTCSCYWKVTFLTRNSLIFLKTCFNDSRKIVLSSQNHLGTIRISSTSLIFSARLSF